MATAFVIPGVTFTKNLGVVALPIEGPDGYPVGTGLEAYHLLKTNSAQATDNLVTGKPNGTLVGNPTFNANSMVGGYENGIQTGITIADPVATFIVVSKDIPGSSDQEVLMGNGQGFTQGNQGVNLSWFSGSQNAFSAEKGTAGSVAISSFQATDVDGSKFRFLAGVVNGTTIQVFRGSNGVLTAGPVVSDATIQAPQSNPRQVRIGGAYLSTFGATTELAAAVIHKAALTQAQVQLAYNFMKTKFDALGVLGL